MKVNVEITTVGTDPRSSVLILSMQEDLLLEQLHPGQLLLEPRTQKPSVTRPILLHSSS
jgi:hypothetical protein